MKLAILSDTHGLLRPEVLERLKQEITMMLAEITDRTIRVEKILIPHEVP